MMMSNLVKIDYKLPSVGFKKDELKTVVAGQVKSLKGFHTEHDMKTALASVRKIIKGFDEQRKDITRKWDDVKKSFTSDVADALKPAFDLEKEYVLELDILDQERKEAKHGDIMEIDGIDEWLSYFEKMPDEWMNRTVTLDDINDRIKSDLLAVEERKETIKRACKVAGLDDTQRYIEMVVKTDLHDILDRIHDDAMLLRSKGEPQVKGEIIKGEIKQLANDEQWDLFWERLKAYDARADAKEKLYTRVREITMTKSQALLLKTFCDAIGVELRSVTE